MKKISLEAVITLLMPLVIVVIGTLSIILSSVVISLITVFATIIFLIVANSVKPYVKGREITGFINTAIVGGFALFLLLGSLSYTGAKTSSLAWIISVGISVIWGLLKYKNQYKRDQKLFELLNFFLLTLIIPIISILGVASNFGSQTIWLPILSTSLIIAINEIAGCDDPFWKGREKLFLLFALIATGLISTIYQFWHSEIFLGVKFWQLLSFLVALLVLLFSFILIRQRIKEGREEKRRNKEREEKLTAEKKRKEEEKSKIQSILDKKDILSWKEILAVDKYFNLIRLPKDFVEKVGQNSDPLISLVSISVLKSQIIWRDELKSSLILIDQMISYSYEDKLILDLMKKIEELISILKPLSYFKGYEALLKEIGSLENKDLFMI